MTTAIDRTSPTWAAIRAHIEYRLEHLRDELESADIADGHHNVTRGRIAELRDLLAQADERPGFEIDAPDYHA